MSCLFRSRGGLLEHGQVCQAGERVDQIVFERQDPAGVGKQRRRQSMREARRIIGMEAHAQELKEGWILERSRKGHVGQRLDFVSLEI